MYVIRSDSSGRRYVGQTNDLARRVAEHNHPHHKLRKFTSRHAGPWVLVHQEVYPRRAEAMRREKCLRSGAGRAWLDNVIGRASPAERE